ncbi:hypothetical protein PTTG_29355 [Puccinia triticina 1-1 BBBD Race 1]|uniref:Uncharacterized protein n=1 Tax=Puccinia triticina (isolate 1-1 / race 1 (BBBD)) TaxID=630390 RepID=A0A180G4V9_PUCT1|nr:hypothetical protein PTTG_29355 [Puccinia triticina 1-1 BBBD Race 1]
MSDNKSPSGRFVPRPLNKPIPGLRTIDRTTPTMKSVLGPQLSGNDYFRRRLARGTPAQNANEGVTPFFRLDKGKDREVSEDFPEETSFQPRITGRIIGSSASNWRRTDNPPHLANPTASQSSETAGPSGQDRNTGQSDIAELVIEMRLQREAKEARRHDERLRRATKEARTQARFPQA